MPIVLGVFGALIGSFLNVVAYRVPLRRSIVSPPSACTGCGNRIRGYDNIPVFSWLVLRGRCRSCKSHISARYPLVELATAVFFVAVSVRFWPAIESAATTGQVAPLVASILILVVYLYFAAISVALTLIDLDTRTLPNRIVLPSYIVACVLFSTSALLDGDWAALLRAAIGLGILWLAYAVMALSYPGGMGFGDVKLAGLVGLYLAWLGWGSLAVGAFAAFVFGGLFAIALLVSHRATRKSGIPFGPWILAGAWIGVFAGQLFASAYLSLFGIA